VIMTWILKLLDALLDILGDSIYTCRSQIFGSQSKDFCIWKGFQISCIQRYWNAEGSSHQAWMIAPSLHYLSGHTHLLPGS
jgi:hypothetical protein